MQLLLDERRGEHKQSAERSDKYKTAKLADMSDTAKTWCPPITIVWGF